MRKLGLEIGLNGTGAASSFSLSYTVGVRMR